MRAALIVIKMMSRNEENNFICSVQSFFSIMIRQSVNIDASKGEAGYVIAG